MKILSIVSRPVYPPTDGGQIVAYHTMKHLALRGHAITVASVVNGPSVVPELQRYCTWIPGPKLVADSYFAMLINLISPLPYTIAKYRDRILTRTIDEICRDTRFDIIQAEGLHTADYAVRLGRRWGVPTVLRAYNVESEIMEGFWRHSAHPLVKGYAYIQYRKLYRYEIRMCEQFDKCVMISKDDQATITRMNPRIRSCVVPAGVDTTYFRPSEGAEESYSLVFVGSLDWFPNEEGIAWFLKDVFPKVKAHVPECKLYIVGKNPPRWLRTLNASDVVVTGFVADVREYMARSAVFIAPLKTGSGIRVKILNAMAIAKPVVTTSVGSRGLGLEAGKHALVADDAKTFAAQVTELLSDRQRRREIAEAGLALVLEKFTWPRVIDRLEKEYQELLRR